MTEAWLLKTGLYLTGLPCYGSSVGEKQVLSPEQKVVREWVKANRGLMSKIAYGVSPPLTPQFVRMIAYGTTNVGSDHRVKRELRAAGWPGVR